MTLIDLNHVTVRTHELEKTRHFYVNLLGMTVGDRPDFDFPGYWLYVGDQPVMHLVGIEPEESRGLENYLGSDRGPMGSGTGAFDHVAFSITEPSGLLARLEKEKQPYRQRQVPGTDLLQIFVEDPNGVMVELNYHG